MRVVFTSRAERHLDHIYHVIATASYESRADAFVGRIVTYCEGFTTFPHRGTRRDDISPGLRTVGFERRVTLAFKVTEEEVIIAGVYYGGRNWEDSENRDEEADG